MVFVRAAVRLEHYFDPLPLWRRIARGGLTVVEVPDGHYDMVGRNAHLIAVAIDRALESA